MMDWIVNTTYESAEFFVIELDGLWQVFPKTWTGEKSDHSRGNYCSLALALASVEKLPEFIKEVKND